MLRGGCPVIVHYWADLQSVHGFRCYDNIAPNAKCSLFIAVYMRGIDTVVLGATFTVRGAMFLCAKAANELSHEWKNYSVAETNQRSRYDNVNDA